ncbi:uncharacterized protein LOC103721101 isoform X1 [Phoenix dactylifera]|uniref:Uncharacterized protein LOC103721101 isoform X1 n=1 Tax=Phoenix dactylifera TaxID=42345 RepID=A0A8B7CYV7_PHODC|nr:uncharacterized protein LOC103721101 isoform X1 [Phoenix dactylifera]
MHKRSVNGPHGLSPFRLYPEKEPQAQACSIVKQASCRRERAWCKDSRHGTVVTGSRHPLGFGLLLHYKLLEGEGDGRGPMAAYDLAQRLLPGQAPTEHTIRRRLVAVAMFALCVAFGGFLLAGAQSRLIFQMMILIANFTVFFLGLLVIYFFMPISSGIPGLPISADRLISVTLAVSVFTMFLNSTCLILVAG